MAADRDPYRLSSPRIFLVRILVFLILVGFVALILYRQIAIAFMANPGLNTLIICVLFVGILLALRQVWRLFREVRWVNALRKGEPGLVAPPVLLAPMATMLGDRVAGRAIIGSALDNLTKGASGQAVQNMNLMLGFPETMGLEQVALFP